jgi:hypothetical protein
MKPLLSEKLCQQATPPACSSSPVAGRENFLLRCPSFVNDLQPAAKDPMPRTSVFLSGTFKRTGISKASDSLPESEAFGFLVPRISETCSFAVFLGDNHSQFPGRSGWLDEGFEFLNLQAFLEQFFEFSQTFTVKFRKSAEAVKFQYVFERGLQACLEQKIQSCIPQRVLLLVTLHWTAFVFRNR